jgi:lipopolysaccharide/colanic/teichoic acid biosynthesis glycosyltransferase
MIRFLDIIFSSISLLLLFPFGLIISLILKLTGEGEIFYTQERIGKNGRKFDLLKFATMLKDSPLIGTGDITVKDDPRVLPFGKILRITKINELPQLINILVGDMSIVGPRPQTPKNFDYFPEELKKIILSMRPGLTGIGSIVFRDEETIVALYSDKSVEDCYREIIAPYKGELEKWYQKRQHIATYFLIIFVTMWVVVYPKSEIYFKIWPSLPSSLFFPKQD